MNRPEIVLASTGGTITMTSRQDGAGVAPTLTAADLVGSVPGLAAIADIVPVAFARKPSASLTLDDLIALADLLRARFAGGADGAVVGQGTDTIEEAAFVLALLLPGDSPIVVTGAMRAPAIAGADGPANLLAAVTVAASEGARGLGPLVVLNDQIHAAAFVQKSHTALVSAFTSPGLGPLGVICEGRAHIQLRPAHRTPALDQLCGRQTSDGQAHDVWRVLSDGRGDATPGATATPQPQVALLRIGLDDDGRLLDAAPDLGFAGVVLEGAGAGHVPGALAAIVLRVAAHIPVVLASRVSAGPVFRATYGYPGSEIDLLARGAICAGFLTGLKARLLLQLLLRVGADAPAIRAAFAHFQGSP